jgi:hypothetical protein
MEIDTFFNSEHIKLDFNQIETILVAPQFVLIMAGSSGVSLQTFHR